MSAIATSRSEARERGEKTYFTGKPCKHGHVAKRYVVGGKCVACNIASLQNNKERSKIQQRRWSENNRGRRACYKTTYRRARLSQAAAYEASRRALKLKATPVWADRITMREMYAQAAAWQAAIGLDFNVDHIVPLRGKNVCGLHVEDNLSVIPALWNRRKHNSFEGITYVHHPANDPAP